MPDRDIEFAHFHRDAVRLLKGLHDRGLDVLPATPAAPAAHTHLVTKSKDLVKKIAGQLDDPKRRRN